MRLTISEYSGDDALDQLKDDWERLYSLMPTRSSPQSLEAHRAYYDLYVSDPRKYRCLAVSDGSRVRAICPLEARDDRVLGFPVRVWGIPIQPHQPLADLICPDDDIRSELIPLIAAHLQGDCRGRPLLVVGPLPQSSALWRSASRLPHDQVCVNEPSASHVFDTSGTYDQLLGRLSKNFRAKLRKARNRLDKLEDAHYVHATSATALARECETFLEIEASGWKGAAGTRSAVLFRDRQPALYRRLARPFGPGDGCEINSLYADGRCIASNYCMRSGDHYAILKSGYDEDYGRASPGQLLRGETLRRCCEDPSVNTCSLLSDFAWQDVWHPDTVVMRQVHVAIGRYKGPALVRLLHLRFGAGRVAARWVRARLPGRGGGRSTVSAAGAPSAAGGSATLRPPTRGADAPESGTSTSDTGWGVGQRQVARDALRESRHRIATAVNAVLGRQGLKLVRVTGPMTGPDDGRRRPAPPWSRVPFGDDHVLLREPSIDDVPALVAALADHDMAYWTGWPAPFDEADARRWLRSRAVERCTGQALDLIIVDRRSDHLVGLIQLHRFDWHYRRASIGLWLVPGARGRGLMTYALSLFVSWVFRETGLRRLEYLTMADNDAAVGLAERCGLQREGLLRGRMARDGDPQDAALYAALSDDWPAAV